jgi:hypothetical protein
MMQVCRARQQREAAPQYFLAVGLVSEFAVGIGEVDVGADEARIERAALVRGDGFLATAWRNRRLPRLTFAAGQSESCCSDSAYFVAVSRASLFGRG